MIDFTKLVAPQQITYADLRDDDVLIDRSGGRWHVSGVAGLNESPNPVDVTRVSFWLGDVRTKVRQHHMTKPAGDAVTVERVETHADQVAALEASYPGLKVPDVDLAGIDANIAAQDAHERAVAEIDQFNPWQTAQRESEAHEAAVAEMERHLNATVDVDVTAAEVDAAARATEDDPVVLPLFESMTDLEQRSHLFVMHGTFAQDVEDRIERSRIHAEAHKAKAQNKLRGRHTPHVHSEAAK